MLEVDVNTYLPGDLLTKIDIATMAYSLEARSPLLDHELMELAASLPADLKARGGQRRWILRGALRGWVPDEILDGRKQGFELPVSGWLRADLRPTPARCCSTRPPPSAAGDRSRWSGCSTTSQRRADHGSDSGRS